MFIRKKLFIATAVFSLLSYRFDSFVLPAEAASLTKTELIPFSESLINVVEADLSQAFTGQLLKGNSASFSYAGLDSLLHKNESCTNINLSKVSELVTESFLEFDCPQVKGSKEVQNTKSEDSWVFSGETHLDIYDKDQIYEINDRATLHFSREGNLQIEKEFEDIKKEAFSTSSIEGSLNYDLQSGGEFELDGTATLSDEGRPQRALVITSNNLKYDKCGLREGTLNISTGQQKLTVIFTNCKHHVAFQK